MFHCCAQTSQTMNIPSRYNYIRRFAVITTFMSRFSVKKVSGVITHLRTLRTVDIRLFYKCEPSVLVFTSHQGSLYQLTSLADVRCHIVASMYVRFRYSGKNQMRFAVFWRISVRFSGFPQGIDFFS